jgi:hypothetical protein
MMIEPPYSFPTAGPAAGPGSFGLLQRKSLRNWYLAWQNSVELPSQKYTGPYIHIFRICAPENAALY